MGAWLSVQGHNRPAVGQNLCEMSSQIDHRLDRKNISCLDFGTVAGLPVIGYLRIFVHPAPDSMPHIVPHDSITVLLGMFLDGPANVAEMLAWPALLNRPVKTLLGRQNQMQTILADLPY